MYVAGILLALLTNTRQRVCTEKDIVKMADIGRAPKIVNIPSSVRAV